MKLPYRLSFEARPAPLANTFAHIVCNIVFRTTEDACYGRLFQDYPIFLYEYF
jgi:hypothetical protein